MSNREDKRNKRNSNGFVFLSIAMTLVSGMGWRGGVKRKEFRTNNIHFANENMQIVLLNFATDKRFIYRLLLSKSIDMFEQGTKNARLEDKALNPTTGEETERERERRTDINNKCQVSKDDDDISCLHFAFSLFRGTRRIIDIIGKKEKKMKTKKASRKSTLDCV
jgi:hypothetical protein